MSETPSEQSPPPSGMARWIPWALLTMIGVAAGAALYVITQAAFQPADQGLEQFRRASLHRLRVLETSARAPAVTVANAAGEQVPLVQDGAGLTLVNLWATWCAPCVAEMPTFAAAQREYGPRGLRVVAVSVDRPQEQPQARAFMARQAPLTFYADPTMSVFNALQPRPMGLPVTLVIDHRGRERARVVGDADWTSPEARGLIERMLSEAGARPATPRP